MRSRTLDLSFPNPRVIRIQPGKLHGKGDIFDLAASLAAEVTVLIGNGIEALLPRVRVQAANDSLGCHEFQVAIHGSETDAGKPSSYPQVHLIRTGMIPAETEFLQDHGSLLRFSQNR